jgi:hypothetical protein
MDEKEVAEAILDYLNEHPHAMDTLEGIAGWWVQRQQTVVRVTMLVKVLRRLTDIGLLEELDAGDTRRYRLRKE